VIHVVGDELDAVIRRLFPEDEDGGPDEAPAECPEGGERVPAGGGGYLQAVDEDGLVEFARRRDLLVRLERRPGDYVTRGRTLAGRRFSRPVV